jgi:hypothetical protein
MPAGWHALPTMSTLWHYAEAIGARIKLGVEAEPASAG